MYRNCSLLFQLQLILGALPPNCLSSTRLNFTPNSHQLVLSSGFSFVELVKKDVFDGLAKSACMPAVEPAPF